VYTPREPCDSEVPPGTYSAVVRAELIASALASRLASRRLAALVRFDGLYDVVSSEEAVDVVRKRLVENAGDPVRAAASLCSTAVDDRGSRDE